MNVVESLLIASEHPTWLTLEDLPAHMLAVGVMPLPSSETKDFDLKRATQRLEMEYVRNALAVCDNNRVKAAELLKIPRATLYKKYPITG